MSVATWLVGAIALAPVAYFWLGQIAGFAPRTGLLVVGCWLAIIWPLSLPLLIAGWLWERIRG